MKIIAGLLITCCLFAVVGCSSGGESATPTATAKTPIQLLNESTAARFTSVWTALNAKASNTDLSALANRVGTLEGQNAPDLAAFTAKDTALEGRIAGLESLNISDTLSDIEAELAFLRLQLGTPTPTPATPTPTPTVMCGVQRPTLTKPDYGGTINAGTVNFQWNTCTNADHYEFYLGTTPSVIMVTNISAPFHSIQYPANTADTYYYWKVVSVSPCGDKSQSDGWWFKTSP